VGKVNGWRPPGDASGEIKVQQNQPFHRFLKASGNLAREPFAAMLAPMAPPARIAIRVVTLVTLACAGSVALLGVSTEAIGLGVVFYLVAVGALACLQWLTPTIRWFLPERRGMGVASLAAIVYWGCGWAMPPIAFAVAVHQSDRLAWSDWLVVAVGAVLLTAASYCLLCEPHWLKVRKLELPYRDLPRALAGLRIVHLSDLHLEGPGRWIAKLRSAIESCRPDLVCITGDLASDCRSADSLSVRAVNELLRGIRARFGVFVVYGDWDGHGPNWPDIERRMLADTPARALEDETVRIEVGDALLAITGRSPAHRNAKPDLLARLPRDGFSIVLHHYPFGAMRAAEVGVDLYLAGHTHGGQIRLPWLGSFYRRPRGGRDRGGRVLPRLFESSLHRIDETWIHVSTGIGTRGGDAPRVRLFCRPEVVLLVLERDVR